MNEREKTEIKRLLKTYRHVVVCSVDDNGFPAAKAMSIIKSEGAHTLWFSTNVSSTRTAQFLKNSKACVYFMDIAAIHGLSLTGEMTVITDDKTKAEFWFEGAEMYYPQGRTDPDYCIYKFTAEKGRYYHNLESISFTADINLEV